MIILTRLSSSSACLALWVLTKLVENRQTNWKNVKTNYFKLVYKELGTRESLEVISSPDRKKTNQGRG